MRLLHDKFPDIGFTPTFPSWVPEHLRVMSRIKAWQVRLKRVNTMLRKLTRQKRYYRAGPSTGHFSTYENADYEYTD